MSFKGKEFSPEMIGAEIGCPKSNNIHTSSRNYIKINILQQGWTQTLYYDKSQGQDFGLNQYRF